MTQELVEVLSVFARLVELEPNQADLLVKIMSGPLVTKGDFTEAGVLWPLSDKNSKPRFSGHLF